MRGLLKSGRETGSLWRREKSDNKTDRKWRRVFKAEVWYQKGTCKFRGPAKATMAGVEETLECRVRWGSGQEDTVRDFGGPSIIISSMKRLAWKFHSDQWVGKAGAKKSARGSCKRCWQLGRWWGKMVALSWQRDDWAGDVAGDGQTTKENGPGFLTWAEGHVLSKMENGVGADLRGKIKGSDLGVSGLDAIR